jgi:hypothetical protein
MKLSIHDMQKYMTERRHIREALSDDNRDFC